MIERLHLYINGTWQQPDGCSLIDVINPATESTIARIPAASSADADRAVAAARSAADSWGNTSADERSAVLSRILQGLKERAGEIAQTITAEVGMPIKLSRRIQAGLPLIVLESYVNLLADYPFEEQIGNSRVVREPVGVAACITPWNYPLHQVVAKIAPALAAGCTVVLKPSEVAPLSAFILADVIHDAGLPAGVFNLVSGYGDPVGERLASHPEVDLVSFTGSTRAGRRVSELAAVTVKRVALELGGKSAAVILDDADIPSAVKSTMGACFINSGQTCTAHTRLLVPEQLYERTAALAVEIAASYSPGDPSDEQTRLGPLVSKGQQERVRSYINRGIVEGAVLLAGGPAQPDTLPTGYYVSPTVFGGVTPDMTIAQEEIFGPVLSIMTYRDENDAIRIANDTNYGLAGAVWSYDQQRAERIARRMRAGQIDINGGSFNPLAPFGGYKQSGHGRELGRFGLEEYLEVKSMQFRR